MATSILTDVKKVLGLEEAYTAFDPDITMHINSAFSTLNQLGIGPENGFAIVDKTATWDSFIGTNPRYNSVKTYVYLKVRLVFDPPSTSFAIDAMKEMIRETEWRLNVLFENETWEPEITDDGVSLILDGGVA